jgi:hypothetical protein
MGLFRRPDCQLTRVFFKCTRLGIANLLQLAAQIDTPKSFCLNYEESRGIQQLNNREFLDDLEYLYVDGKHQDQLLTCSMVPGTSDLFELALWSDKSDESSPLRHLDACRSFVDVIYGYSRRVARNFSITNETRARTTLFGSVVLRVKPYHDSWMMPVKDLSRGAVKGIYPMNFWNANVLGRLAALGINLAPYSSPSEGIFVFDKAAQALMLQQNPMQKKFLRFDPNLEG